MLNMATVLSKLEQPCLSGSSPSSPYPSTSTPHCHTSSDSPPHAPTSLLQPDTRIESPSRAPAELLHLSDGDQPNRRISLRVARAFHRFRKFSFSSNPSNPSSSQLNRTPTPSTLTPINPHSHIFAPFPTIPSLHFLTQVLSHTTGLSRSIQLRPTEHQYTVVASQSLQTPTQKPCDICLDLFRRSWAYLNADHTFRLDLGAWLGTYRQNTSKPDHGPQIVCFQSPNIQYIEAQFSLEVEMAKAKQTPGRSRARDKEQGWSKPDPDLEQSGVQDIEMADSAMAMTPVQAGDVTQSVRAFARPMTRSMTSPGTVMVALSYETTSFRERIRRSSKKPLPTLNLSGLEGSKSITYGDEQADEPDEDEDNADSEMQDQDQPLVSPTLPRFVRKRPKPRQVRMPIRRSARINGLKAGANGPINSGPVVKRRARNIVTKAKLPLGPKKYLRRSPRLAKPLTEFHLYSKLPNEIKMMIWEYTIVPRLVYICNRSSLLHAGVQFGVQNPYPRWFMTCKISAWVARLHYQKRFALHSNGGNNINLATIQDFNSVNDIVIFEPCHGACRGCHCARHQYCEADRSAVRFLAVQTESPNLPANTESCWQSVTRSWPNVETLYLMRVAVRGISTTSKAMIRVKPNDFEMRLRSRFEQWKKGPGSNVKISKLEFVVVVPKEDTTVSPCQRYRSVNERLTGLPEDIILG
ncbi:hypothetical protein F4776DRAFT_586790 [Hypoxylon sp. NC0597]|nr:hypothetical protein F4776DRAFT_586790 [Hypoxylon sp. NC0597]